jgi:hypothetical protein
MIFGMLERMWRNIMNTYVINLDKIPNRETTKETIERHIAHLRKLDQDDCLVLAVPFTDYPFGMALACFQDLILI